MGDRRSAGRACFALVFAGMLACPNAFAQTMYRYGNRYQDRPCDAGQKGKAAGSTGTAAAAPAAGRADADCAQRGKDALKVVWAREGGATEEQLLDEISRKPIPASEKEKQKGPRGGTC